MDKKHYKALFSIEDRNPEYLDTVMLRVARLGYTKCMKLMRERGATNWNKTLIVSIQGNQLEAFKLLYEWGRADISIATILAAQLDRRDILKYLHARNESLTYALCDAELPTMQYILSLGLSQNAINEVTVALITEGHIAKFEIMLTASPDPIVAIIAAIHNRLDALIIMHYRDIQFDYDLALYYAVKNKHYECATAIAEWGAKPNEAMDYAVSINDINSMLFVAQLPGWTPRSQLHYIKHRATEEQSNAMFICWIAPLLIRASAN